MSAPFTQSEFGPLKVIPLGGVGEFGMNMMLFEYEGAIMAVDAGLMFPDSDMLGVDIVVPDFSYLQNPSKSILGVILTHGHEDHIGAVPYLLRKWNIPVYGTRLTLALLAEKMKEHRLPYPPQLISIKPRDTISLGPFSVEAISVTHSIVDSVAYAITTPVGCLIHTGDFKMDSTPVGDNTFDADRFVEYGKRGVLALFSDSTNAEQKGFTPSEADVGVSFERLFSEIKGRILISAFSSNIHRIDQIAQIARQRGKKVFLSGKSVVVNTRIACETGYFSFPYDQFSPLDTLSETPDRETVIFTTGSQGEPTSALFRIATDDHKQIQIKPGDTVILSARFIPGNEAAISNLINLLLRKGAHVLHEKIAPVHVSGHASQGDQKKMIELVEPKFFVPIHGEYRQLSVHASSAMQCGLSSEQVNVIENGETLLLGPSYCERGKTVPADKIYIDGKGGLEAPLLKERRQLGSEGIIIVTLSIENGKIRSGPTFLSRGFTSDDHAIWEEMSQVLKKIFLQEEIKEKAEIEAKVIKTLKKRISKQMGRFPMIIPDVMVT